MATNKKWWLTPAVLVLLLVGAPIMLPSNGGGGGHLHAVLVHLLARGRWVDFQGYACGARAPATRRHGRRSSVTRDGGAG